MTRSLGVRSQYFDHVIDDLNDPWRRRDLHGRAVRRVLPGYPLSRGVAAAEWACTGAAPRRAGGGANSPWRGGCHS